MPASRPTPFALATISTLAVASLGLWGWSIDPGHPGRWSFIMFFLPSMWGYVELMQFRGSNGSVARSLMDFHRYSVAWGGLLVATSVGLQLMVAAELLGPEWVPFSRRVTGVILGFGMTLFGNYLPKLLSPWSVRDQPFDWQRVHRFAGWVCMLGGISMMTLWLTLPVDQARHLAGRVFLVVVALVVGRKMLSFVTRSTVNRAPQQ